uniref:Uncharacterized protein n=1 Tax=Oryza glumipatula TaxID=40148 RepID=A0A0E0B934_9ORYZ
MEIIQTAQKSPVSASRLLRSLRHLAAEQARGGRADLHPASRGGEGRGGALISVWRVEQARGGEGIRMEGDTLLADIQLALASRCYLLPSGMHKSNTSSCPTITCEEALKRELEYRQKIERSHPHLLVGLNGSPALLNVDCVTEFNFGAHIGGKKHKAKKLEILGNRNNARPATGNQCTGNRNPGPNGNAGSGSRNNEPNVFSSNIAKPSSDIFSGSQTNGTIGNPHKEISSDGDGISNSKLEQNLSL